MEILEERAKRKEISSENVKTKTRKRMPKQKENAAIMFRKKDFIAIPELAERGISAVMQRMAVKDGENYFREKRASWIVKKIYTLSPDISKKEKLDKLAIPIDNGEELNTLAVIN